MDLATIDARYSDLERESQATVTAIATLAQKLQAEAGSGNQQAREWLLDLKEIALELRDEQNQTRSLLQALHDFVVNQVPAQQGFQPAPPIESAPAQQVQYQQAGGGMLSRFMGGGFGRALGMGAAFGVGDSLINDLFS